MNRIGIEEDVIILIYINTGEIHWYNNFMCYNGKDSQNIMLGKKKLY